MHVYISSDLAHDYAQILRMVRDFGKPVSPRGLGTRELLAFTLKLEDPTRALPLGTGRKIHMGLAAAEALQLVGGFSDPEAMSKVSPHLSAFTDGGVFHAPYGPRIATQMPLVIDWLNRDPSTRKAYISVWDPLQDLLSLDTRDHPCTTHLQFMIRKNALDLHVGMRANDAWRGFPYDVFQFCQLQLAVADLMRRPVGNYYHHATSFHLYDSDLDRVDALTTPNNSVRIDGVQWSGSNWRHVQARARQLFYGNSEELKPSHMGDGESRMWRALRNAGVTGSW